MKNKSDLGTRFGLSDNYVNGLTDEQKEMYNVIRPLRKSGYSIDVHLANVEQKVESLSEEARIMGGVLQLNPDFQRGHVWTTEKQVSFIENFFRKITPNVLRFNCPTYFDEKEVKDLVAGDIVCVDGLQRLTAMRDFMSGKFKIFNSYFAEDLKNTPFDPRRSTFKVEMFDIPSKKELLRFYLDINTGGVVHSDEEILRVSKMFEDLK